MKKVRIEVKPAAGARSFYLFPSAEHLYEWGCSTEDTSSSIMDSVDVIELLEGGFIEAEWLGCEYVYEGSIHKKFDFVRVGVPHEPQNSSGTLVSMHYGWVEDAWIPFRDIETDVIVVKSLTAEDCRLNMPDLSEVEVDVSTLALSDDDGDDE